MKNDLIRRSELLAKKCMVRGHLDTGSPCPSKVVAVPVDVIERAKAVDAVEVVRCKDCIHREDIEGWGNSSGYCVLHSSACCGYCEDGERKDGDGSGCVYRTGSNQV